MHEELVLWPVDITAVSIRTVLLTFEREKGKLWQCLLYGRVQFMLT